MTPALNPALTFPLTLPTGACRTMQVVSGSRWTVTAGRVRLTGPLQELGGRVVGIDVLLTEGGSEVVEPGGWVRIQALTASALVVEPAAPRSGWRRWLPGRSWLPGRARFARFARA